MKDQSKKYSRLFSYAENSTMVQLTLEAIRAKEQNLSYGQMKAKEAGMRRERENKPTAK